MAYITVEKPNIMAIRPDKHIRAIRKPSSPILHIVIIPHLLITIPLILDVSLILDVLLHLQNLKILQF